MWGEWVNRRFGNGLAEEPRTSKRVSVSTAYCVRGSVHCKQFSVWTGVATQLMFFDLLRCRPAR